MAVLKSISLSRSSLDQAQLRTYIMLASSFLALDTSLEEHPQNGIATWRLGWDRIVDLLTALHYREELEVATVNAASRALSECWSVSGSYRGLEGGRDGVREIATRIKKLLDEDGVRYKGQIIYVP